MCVSVCALLPHWLSLYIWRKKTHHIKPCLALQQTAATIANDQQTPSLLILPFILWYPFSTEILREIITWWWWWCGGVLFAWLGIAFIFLAKGKLSEEKPFYFLSAAVLEKLKRHHWMLNVGTHRREKCFLPGFYANTTTGLCKVEAFGRK